MRHVELKDYITSLILPTVRTPGQYVGGELNSVATDHATARGSVCLAFPDAYALGMSHHGLQVLYSLMNEQGWACERAFTPLPDFEEALRKHGLPLYGLESFTPLHEFDVLGFSLQYEICSTNVLTMLDLGGIPLHAEDRGAEDTLVIAGGPCAQNPELLAPFIDLFVIGDGEPSLPVVTELWTGMKGLGLSREEKLARIAGAVPWAYVPRFYEPIYGHNDVQVGLSRLRDDVPETIRPCVISCLDSLPLPTKPVVPFVETSHDRIAIEIMRGCPWQCRFCQSTVIKRPLRIREVETIVAAALESYRQTGYDEISLLSLSTSDYPYFEKLVERMHETFRPLGVNISVPSLRVNEQLKSVAKLIDQDRPAAPNLTQLLGRAITPDYASPEQVRGQTVTVATDVYSLGVVLYELLTGERLFVGETDFSTLEKVRNVEILPPSTYNRKIPEELEQIVMRALAREPEERYATANDLHDDLQAFMYTSGEFYSRKELATWMKTNRAKVAHPGIGTTGFRTQIRFARDTGHLGDIFLFELARLAQTV